MARRLILVSLGALILIVSIGVAWFVLSPPSDATDAATAVASTLPPDRITADDHVMGNTTAPLTMIEYFAQACSVCSRFDQEVFPLLKAKYIDTGKVRYVMRLFPLFPIDGPSYKLDMCMPPGQFFQTADLLFRNQPKWDSAEYPVSDPHAGLVQMARILGMGAAQADACMNSTKYDDAINKVTQDANARYQVQSTGTPTFVLDFKKAELFDPRDTQGSWQKIQTAIDAALAAKGAK